MHILDTIFANKMALTVIVTEFLATYNIGLQEIPKDVSILKYNRYTSGMLSTQNDAHREIRTFLLM